MRIGTNDEEIKRFLPQFISEASKNDFLKDLKKFPLHKTRYYSQKAFFENGFLQGDGFRNGVIVNMSNNSFVQAPCMIFSNSCDISADNKRAYPTSVCYAPILSLSKFKKSLEDNQYGKSRINSLIDTIKKQAITSVLYLPICQALAEEKMILMDRIQSCPLNIFMTRHNAQDKIFTLSNYAFYLFLIKMSIHFTRIRDGVDRVSS